MNILVHSKKNWGQKSPRLGNFAANNPIKSFGKSCIAIEIFFKSCTFLKLGYKLGTHLKISLIITNTTTAKFLFIDLCGSVKRILLTKSDKKKKRGDIYKGSELLPGDFFCLDVV